MREFGLRDLKHKHGLPFGDNKLSPTINSTSVVHVSTACSVYQIFCDIQQLQESFCTEESHKPIIL